MSTESIAGIFSQKVESALLVAIQFPSMVEAGALAHIGELTQLVDTMGLRVADTFITRLRAIQPKYLVGTGKAGEIAELADTLEADCIIFDDDLSPSQQRNWEALTSRCVIDRHEVILDIFAARANTREAELQVALARMEYSLPRLTRAWTHLSRQRGGSRGTRGEGETQLEADRRVVLRKIDKLKGQLKQVRSQRATRRRLRMAAPVPTASLVGYTNAGKSSLLNSLTGADVMVEDKLFATLDPTTRRLKIQNGGEVLITDTVGFIRKLPHDLVDAFKSTLEETVLADVLIHVLDAANTEVRHHYETTVSVLEELGAGHKPSILVINKIDLLQGEHDCRMLKSDYPEAIFTSVRENTGLDEVIQRIKGALYGATPISEYRIPNSRYDIAALIHRTGRVIHEQYVDDRILLTAQVPEKTRGICAAYKVE